MGTRRPYQSALLLLSPAWSCPAWATGSLDRLRGVSAHAQQRANSVPDHLWVGVAFAAVLLGLFAIGIYRALAKK